MKTNSKILIAKIIFKILIFFGFKKKTIVKRNDIKWKIDISEGIDLSIFLFGANGSTDSDTHNSASQQKGTSFSVNNATRTQADPFPVPETIPND